MSYDRFVVLSCNFIKNYLFISVYNVDISNTSNQSNNHGVLSIQCLYAYRDNLSVKYTTIFD